MNMTKHIKIIIASIMLISLHIQCLAQDTETKELAYEYYRQGLESSNDKESSQALFSKAHSLIVSLLSQDIDEDTEYELLKMKIDSELRSGRRVMLSLVTRDVRRLLELSEDNNLKLSFTLLWCAEIATRTNDFKQARQLLEESRRIYHTCGITDPGELASYNIQHKSQKAQIELNQGRAPIAAKIQKSILNDIMELYGYGSDEYIHALLDLSSTYSDCSRARMSNLYHGKAYSSYSQNIRERFGRMSESSRSAYWHTVLPYFTKTLDIAYKLGQYDSHFNTDRISKEAFSSIMLSKSILATTSREFDQFVYSTGDSLALNLLYQKRDLIDKDESPAIIDSIETRIIQQLEETGLVFDSPHIKFTWKDVQSNLGPEDLVIEFFQNSEGKYGALLLKKDWGSPLCIRLKDKNNDLESKLTFSAESNTLDLKSQEFWKTSKRIWPRKMLKHFPTTDEGNVYFSPSGALTISAIENLPFINPVSTGVLSTMADNFKMYRITSSRELCISKDKVYDTRASLIGGPDYALRRRHYIECIDSINAASSPIRLIDKEFEHIVSDDTRSSILPANLKYSITEVMQADSILTQQGFVTDVITGKFATEEALEVLPNKGIFHIATHGYHFKVEDVLRRNDIFDHINISDPMLRTGLYLSGVNTTLVNGRQTDKYADGLLSSREIATMNFLDTDLVILSACSSGHGELSEDGVFGLQRAFKKAGANSIIMSLWKVHDKATNEFIRQFYENYICKEEDKYTAFTNAQKALRESEEFSDPFYWASFIILDGDN